MARLTEEMVIARSKQSDLSSVKKLNCWGAELGDVSLLRKMPNVEVLAFSINKIRTLVDFAGCRRLRELYVRKNEIRDLAEIRHLRRLPDLTNLWLDENPCTRHSEYRMTVLRNLPNLEKLDNVPVRPEEVQEAMRRGIHIPDSDDEGYPQQQEQYSQYRTARSCESSPEREPDYYQPQSAREQCPASPRRVASPEDERYDHPAMTTSHYEPRAARSPEAASLRHSVSAQSVTDFAPSNSEWRPSGTLAQDFCERIDRSDALSVREWERVERGQRGANPGAREYSSAVMTERRGFTRRPVARSSNLLSAVLCLVKELDYPSLEVAEMAVRCRMDELANSI
ncbi:cilia- and flagella-associated protein 410-like isoform X2 [Pieris napi]|uniref:cilia- and flagella-associated protein 410-like isoform X2 n=1 Tax=Pieris napi TaxID=78633 RepID=UPI001FB8A306|nr:cilia- and flagella-associated protein 410-like isoform X2 [Pieris napi]